MQRHLRDLKQFVFDPAVTDPAKVARADRREFEIDHIVTHVGNPKHKSTLEFKVRWAGLEPRYDRWLPWKELMHTVQLQNYLEEHGLTRLLPKEPGAGKEKKKKAVSSKSTNAASAASERAAAVATPPAGQQQQRTRKRKARAAVPQPAQRVTRARKNVPRPHQIN